MNKDDVVWDPDSDPRRQKLFKKSPATTSDEAEKFLAMCRELDAKFPPKAIKPKDFSSSSKDPGQLYKEMRDKDPVVQAMRGFTVTFGLLDEAVTTATKSIDAFAYAYDSFLKDERMESHQLGSKTVLTHTSDKCKGRNCVIHNPSNHQMREWPRNFRQDTGRTERLCIHGIGHPDPDDVAYWVSQGKSRTEIWTHGCDGCCAAQDEMSEVPEVELPDGDGRLADDREDDPFE